MEEEEEGKEYATVDAQRNPEVGEPEKEGVEQVEEDRERGGEGIYVMGTQN